MTLKEEWDRLDPETRNWLLDNPACALVPSTLTARIQENSDKPIEIDEHGQMILSREDLDFIREKGTGVGAATSVTTFASSMQPSPGKTTNR